MAEDDAVRARVDAVFRADSRRVLATLVRRLCDFDLAEEALQQAFEAALERWPREGVPENAFAWLVSAGRFRAVDTLRRRARFDAAAAELSARVEQWERDTPELDEVGDDRLRLVFACCHPALALEAQVALTLREVGGLTTEEIARAFLVPAPTIAQRIVRAKARLREADVEYRVPALGELSERLDAVLRVLYLVFNEGYSASSGETLTRVDLASEALRLARMLHELLPEPEVAGLLALMLLHEARRTARSDDGGELVRLDDQDRSRWDRERIAEGAALVESALRSRRFGPYTLQAAIAAVHAEAPDAASTDWAQIVGLYDLLLRVEPSPIVELNRALALGMRDGPAPGLERIDALLERGELASYAPAFAARAELLRELGRDAEAREAYTRAIERTQQEPTRRHLERRRAELS